jgi:TolA-binding protein
MLVSALLCLAFPGPAARADAIWLGATARNPIKAGGVKILRIDGANLVFAGPAGDPVSKPLALVQQIEVDDDPGFSAAEDAYQSGNLPSAVAGYSTALHSSSSDWIQMRSAMRLTALAGKAHAFDSAVSAYIFLLQKNPPLAIRPALGEADSAALTSAATQLNTALAIPTLSDDAQAALLRLSIEVNLARNDSTAENAALGRLTHLGVATPAEAAAATLAAAQTSLAAGNFAKASADIQQHQAIFTEPPLQLEALNLLARAHDGLGSKSTDPATLQDIAIDYMRVVTLGRDLPNQPHVADALLRVGQLEESLKSPAAADVYRQLLKEFPTSAAASSARSSLEHLSSK